MYPLPRSTAQAKAKVSDVEAAVSEKVKSAEQLRIAKLVKEAMEHFENCLIEFKNEYRTLAFNFIELDAEMDSRAASAKQYSADPPTGEPAWIPRSLWYKVVTHGLSEDQLMRKDFKDLYEGSNNLLFLCIKGLKASAKKVAEIHLNNAIKKRYEKFLDSYILIFNLLLRAGMMDEDIDKELEGSTLTHHTDWHLLHHLQSIKIRSADSAQEGHNPLEMLETYLGKPHSFKVTATLL